MPSVPPPLRALVAPRRTFPEWTPGLRTAAVAVLLLAALNAYGVAAGAEAVGDAVTGSVTVENPQRPADWVCEDPGTDYQREQCENQPRTVERSLSRAAATAANGQVPVAFLAPIAAWLVVGAFALVAVDGVDGEYGPALAVAGWASLPAAVRYAARPVLVERAAATWSHPGSVDALQTAAQSFVTGTSLSAFTAVALVSLAWQWYVLGAGLQAAFDATRERAYAAAGVPVVGLAVLATAGPTLVATGPAAFAGLFLLALGLVHVAAPRTLIAIETFFDLIGMRRKHVEPKDWYVWTVRAGGALLATVGFAFVGGTVYF